MSALSISTAKNGSQTASYNAVKLHSFYNPEREAQTFIDNQECTFEPAAIVITEPCLSYTATCIKKRFPTARCIAIRYTHDFDAYNTSWDAVLYTSPSLATELYAILGESMLSATLFLDWQPSSMAFTTQHGETWNAIKQAVVKNRTVLATKAYFTKRWLKNACFFCTTVQHTALLLPGTKPIAVVASGPSLKGSIPYLQKYRADLFIMAVSSAIEPLLFNGITPDMCISTDGGYYAKRHLESLVRNSVDIPLALSIEAATLPVLQNNQTIIPLTYGDYPEQDFLQNMGIPAVHAYRNGTVSGTAIQLALDMTSGPVYVCGLDMAAAKGYQHIQPNALERNNSRNDSKFAPLMKRLSASQLPSDSMDIYRDWFCTHGNLFGHRVYRISDNYAYANTLGEISDLTWQQFTPTTNTRAPVIKKQTALSTTQERKQKLKALLQNMSQTNRWLENAFSAEVISLHRLINDKQKEQAYTTLHEKNATLCESLLRYVENKE